MVDFLSERLEFYQKGEDSDADKQFKNGNYQGKLLKHDCYQNRDSDSEHIEDEEEFCKEIVLGEATENDLDTCPMFVKSSAWSLLFV